MNIEKKTLVKPSLTTADVTTLKATFELLGRIPANNNSDDVIVGFEGEICKMSDLVNLVSGLKDICSKLYIEDDEEPANFNK